MPRFNSLAFLAAAAVGLATHASAAPVTVDFNALPLASMPTAR